MLRRALAEHGEDAALLYDLACFESLAGDEAEAVAHLTRAVELDPGMRRSARADADFEGLRGNVAFVALLGSDAGER